MTLSSGSGSGGYVRFVTKKDDEDDDSSSELPEFEDMADDESDDEPPRWVSGPPETDSFCPVCYEDFEPKTNTDGEVLRTAESRRQKHIEKEHVP